jgi:transcriptional regulator with XRE-family HTH domain
MHVSESHPVDVYVGKRLRLKRTLQGLSQEAIGTAIGVTFQQIQKYERGINRMGASRLYDFSRALGVPVAYFFEGFADESGSANYNAYGMAENNAPSFQGADPMSSRETIDLMRAYYRLKSPMQRKRVLELIKSMAESAES